MSDAETMVESIDKIFGVSEKFNTKNAGYLTYLSARDSNLKAQAETKILQLYNIIKNNKTNIDSLDENSTDNKIYSVVQNFYNEMEALIELSDITLDALDSSVVSSVLTETMLQ